MTREKILDHQQNVLALKKINSILKDKIKSLEFQNLYLKNKIDQYENTEKTKPKKLEFSKSNYSFLALGSFLVLGIMVPLELNVFDDPNNHVLAETSHGSESLKSKYVIENLRGDVIETHVNWKWAKDTPINVSILNSEIVDENKIAVIKNAITSMEEISLDNSLTHKGPKGTVSVYYDGWQGATKQIGDKKTLYSPPMEFNIFKSSIAEGNIVIILEPSKDPSGYSGFTKNMVENNEILKSYVTIYDADSLSESQLGTIVKHEFGHVLGLAHSTDPDDLMHPVIATDFPIISECNIDALEALYNGKTESEVVCRK